MYDLFYKHNDQNPYSLSKFLGSGFFFWWRNYTNFFTLASDGTPVVSVNYDALASSRKHLLSLGHEIGHTNQYDVDNDLWKILGTEVNKDLINELTTQYPTLVTHINDLAIVKLLCKFQKVRAEMLIFCVVD